ncbi:FecR family protein [Zunongwangia mangrovi]|uniref:FecR family protein n=1 Tax=Zunongwangia mangrovi TaxID=1334022 RepID=A0A1I1IRN1_9FLAO|nr:FecR family protein [Zunongwangia mangrovi]SFC38362.1 FecR family protein [Zunongwangia mangrovi]
MEDLIIKYLTNSITDKELHILYNWIQEGNNKQLFKNYVKSNYQIDLLHLPDAEKTYGKIDREINNSKASNVINIYRKNKWFLYAAASVLIIMLTTTLFITSQDKSKNTIIPTESAPITIQLNNGEEINISSNANSINVGSQKVASQDPTKNKLSYLSNSEQVGKEPEYNTIKIPYGKKYELILSDSTVVHLNAGASLKFPVSFQGNKRKVILTGEAFFDVSKDATKPFIVESNKIQIEVLGTKFNVSEYSSRNTSEVVLVEGSVKMNGKEAQKGQILSPGEMGTFDQKSNTLKKEKVDTELYTSWLYGKLIFRNKSFDEILNSLERKFNVEFIVKNEALEKSEFNATFDKDVSLDKMLFYFEQAYNIKYTVKNNKIIIK